MNTNYLFCLFFLLFISNVFSTSSTVTAQFGTSVSLQANTMTTINYTYTYYLLVFSVQLVVEVDNNANVTLSIADSSSFNFPNGFKNNLDFGISGFGGFNFSVSPSNVNVLNATLIITNSQFYDTINESMNNYMDVGLIEYDQTLKAYQEIDIKKSTVDKSLYISIPSPGIYYFANFNLSVTLPTFYGTWRDVQSNITQAFSYVNNFVLKVKSETEAKLLVTLSQINHSLPHGFVNISESFDITFNGNLFNATLSYSFDVSVVTRLGVNISTLQFMYYDVTSNSWKSIPGGYVDTKNYVLYQNTDHFSAWVAAGQTSSSSSTTSSATINSFSIGIYNFLIFFLFKLLF
jgi:hypothetical protein